MWNPESPSNLHADWRRPHARRLVLSPNLERCAAEGSCLEIAGVGDGAALHLVAIVDPLTVQAHKMAALLIALRDGMHAHVTLLLVPKSPPSSDDLADDAVLGGRWSSEPSAASMPLDAFHR